MAYDEAPPEATQTPPRAMPVLARNLGLATPWLALAAALMLGLGLYQALWVSPVDYQQGEYVRMLYLHVPAAWMSLLVYAIMGGASAWYLIGKSPLGDRIARASAPIGLVFASLCLATGMLWGKPIWGTYWVWDARLTSMLMLWLLYLGYIALRRAFDDSERASQPAAILALVGLVNLPIIKFSVEWWNTLHQPASIFRADGPALHPTMMAPLTQMAMAFILIYLLILAMELQRTLLQAALRRKI